MLQKITQQVCLQACKAADNWTKCSLSVFSTIAPDCRGKYINIQVGLPELNQQLYLVLLYSLYFYISIKLTLAHLSPAKWNQCQTPLDNIWV